MKVLVLTKDYPRPDGSHERMFVHVRNMFYQERGIDVTTLNFACDHDYEIDGIRAISLKTYENENEKYDIAVSHASNLRNHYIFLKKHEKEFKNIVFFFHGHEVLKLNEVYPEPYPYMKQGKLKKALRGAYDSFKLALWRKYYYELRNKARFVFVSRWIYDQFKANTGLDNSKLDCQIINNSIGSAFENVSYRADGEKKYNYITIRSNLDGSKYGVDIVVRLAEKNPEQRFLIIGKGKFFTYNKKPDNVDWIDRTLDHEQMLEYINASECGLLLTREDTQGVMTCELASFGIPVITSDIEVCHEFFDVMPNVALINNEDPDTDINAVSRELRKNLPYPAFKKYYAQNTIEKEILLFKDMVGKNNS